MKIQDKAPLGKPLSEPAGLDQAGDSLKISPETLGLVQDSLSILQSRSDLSPGQLSAALLETSMPELSARDVRTAEIPTIRFEAVAANVARFMKEAFQAENADLSEAATYENIKKFDI